MAAGPGLGPAGCDRRHLGARRPRALHESCKGPSRGPFLPVQFKANGSFIQVRRPAVDSLRASSVGERFPEAPSGGGYGVSSLLGSAGFDLSSYRGCQGVAQSPLPGPIRGAHTCAGAAGAAHHHLEGSSACGPTPGGAGSPTAQMRRCVPAWGVPGVQGEGSDLPGVDEEDRFSGTRMAGDNWLRDGVGGGVSFFRAEDQIKTRGVRAGVRGSARRVGGVIGCHT